MVKIKSRRAKATDISQKVKQIVWERDHGKCVICGCTQNVNPNAHYISRKNGGLGIEQNIVTLCNNFAPNQCHRCFDGGTAQERAKIKDIIAKYLKSHYQNWNEEGLIYKKY